MSKRQQLCKIETDALLEAFLRTGITVSEDELRACFDDSQRLSIEDQAAVESIRRTFSKDAIRRYFAKPRS